MSATNINLNSGKYPIRISSTCGFGEWSKQLVNLLHEAPLAPMSPIQADTPEPVDVPATRLVVRSMGRVHFIRVDQIDWIEAADYCVRLHVGDRIHVLRQTMQSLETRLDARRFFRVHRSAIVNLDRVKEIHPYSERSYRLILRDGTELKLSQHRKIELESVLTDSR